MNISKINEYIDRSGANKVVTKYFQRGLQNIETRSAYIGDKLYYRDWTIRGFKKVTKYFQSYNNGIPFKNSRHKLDIDA